MADIPAPAVQKLVNVIANTRSGKGAIVADPIGMLAHSIIFLFSCSVPSIPEQSIPKNTLVLRESLNGPGPERTGNWWGRFDTDGCWWEAHNTWLIVTDPALKDSTAHPLHWNGVEPTRPWFCIDGERLDKLRKIVRSRTNGSDGHGYVHPLDRWTVIDERGVRSHVVYRGMPSGEWQELTDHFDELASVSIWGQSPED